MDQPDGDDREQADDEEQGREQEGPGRFAQASQVENGDDRQDAEADRDGGGADAGEGGCQRPHPGGDRHGDGQGVVNDQGGGRDQADVGAEVVPGHGVGTAAVRVGGDDLAIGEDQDGQEGDDHDGDRQHQVEGSRAGRRQHDDDGLGAVGNRGQGIEGERGQTLDGRDLFLGHSGSGQGSPDEQLPAGGYVVRGGAASGHGIVLPHGVASG